MIHEFMLFGGTANPALARAVGAALGVRLGACSIERFPDGEVAVRLMESVRGKEIFFLQPTSPPVNDHLLELLAFADACRRSAAARVVAVVPYYGYARADKRHGRREPITASMVASLLETVGVGQILTLDLHTTQIEGFFSIPVDTLTAVPTLADAIGGELPRETVVVSPDAGRVQLATEYAGRLGLPLAVLHKRRESGRETHATHLVGEVDGRVCLLVDDIIATGGTLVQSIAALRAAGARGFRIAATHGLLLGDARNRLVEAGAERIYLTDSIPPREEEDDRVRIVSVARLIASALERFVEDASLRDLY